MSFKIYIEAIEPGQTPKKKPQPSIDENERMYITIHNDEESRIAQDIFFSFGIGWRGGGTKFNKFLGYPKDLILNYSPRETRLSRGWGDEWTETLKRKTFKKYTFEEFKNKYGWKLNLKEAIEPGQVPKAKPKVLINNREDRFGVKFNNLKEAEEIQEIFNSYGINWRSGNTRIDIPSSKDLIFLNSMPSDRGCMSHGQMREETTGRMEVLSFKEFKDKYGWKMTEKK